MGLGSIAAALAVALLAAGSPVARARNEVLQGGVGEDPPVLFHRAMTIDEGRAKDASRALDDMIEHVGERHRDNYEITGYTQMFHPGPVELQYVGVSRNLTPMAEILRLHGEDATWQSLLSDLFETATDEVSPACVLLPVTGRSPRVPRPYREWRTVDVGAEGFAHSVRLLTSVTDHLNETHEEVAASLYVQQMGALGRIHWFLDYEDLGAWQSVSRRLLSDGTYLDLLDGWRDAPQRVKVDTRLMKRF